MLRDMLPEIDIMGADPDTVGSGGVAPEIVKGVLYRGTYKV